MGTQCLTAYTLLGIFKVTIVKYLARAPYAPAYEYNDQNPGQQKTEADFPLYLTNILYIVVRLHRQHCMSITINPVK